MNDNPKSKIENPKWYNLHQIATWNLRPATCIRRDGAALLLFIVLALASVYPLLPNPRGLVIGWVGDNVQYAYMTGWVAQALWMGQSPFVDPRLNFPDDLALPATDAPFLSMLAVAPATLLLGPTFGYNLIIVLSYVLSGYFVYRWIVRLSGSRSGGLLAGVVFLLTPYRSVHSFGHLQLVSTQMLPLFFWALDEALVPARPNRRGLLLLGGATMLVALSAQYYLIICLLLGMVYALLALWGRLAYGLRYGWQFALSVGTGAGLGSLPYLSNLRSGIYQAFDVDAMRPWSVDPINFFLPSSLHPLWGGLVNQLRPEPAWFEKTLYLGAVAVALALAALLQRDAALRRRIGIWFAVALAAAIFALGTDLHLNSEPVRADNPVWLPAYYLAQLPVLDLLRVWARFGVISILFVALLAGLGTAAVLRRFSRWRGLALALLVGLAVLDMLPGNLRTIGLAQRPIDRWLAQQPGDFAVAYLPINSDAVNYGAMFGSLFHGKQLPAYNHPNHQPSAYRDFSRRAAAFPAPSSIAALRDMGLRYLILERRYFDGKRAPAWADVAAALEQSAALTIVTQQGDALVVGLEPGHEATE